MFIHVVYFLDELRDYQGLSSSYTQDTERNSNYGGGDESMGFLPLTYYKVVQI
jgi:hypothetical protein